MVAGVSVNEIIELIPINRSFWRVVILQDVIDIYWEESNKMEHEDKVHWLTKEEIMRIWQDHSSGSNAEDVVVWDLLVTIEVEPAHRDYT